MFYGTLELWKGTKIYRVGKRIPTVYYSLTKEIGTYAVCGMALEELKFMPTSVLTGATNKQVIKIDKTHQTKNEMEFKLAELNMARLLFSYHSATERMQSTDAAPSAKSNPYLDRSGFAGPPNFVFLFTAYVYFSSNKYN